MLEPGRVLTSIELAGSYPASLSSFRARSGSYFRTAEFSGVIPTVPDMVIAPQQLIRPPKRESSSPWQSMAWARARRTFCFFSSGWNTVSRIRV